MSKYSALIEKVEANANDIAQLERAFARKTISQMMSAGKARRVGAAIVTLISDIQDIGKARTKARKKYKTIMNNEESTAEEKEAAEAALNEDGKSILQSFLDFLFEDNRETVYGIVAEVFSIDVEDVEDVPLSCIIDCILKDKAVHPFLPPWLRLALQQHSDTLPNAAISQPLPPTPSTLTPSTNKKSLTGKI